LPEHDRDRRHPSADLRKIRHVWHQKRHRKQPYDTSGTKGVYEAKASGACPIVNKDVRAIAKQTRVANRATGGG
jgi:hypothetical protein